MSNVKGNFPVSPKPTIKDKIQMGKLLSIKKIEQRTPEWYSTRMTMITASDWATAIGKGHFGNKNDFILKKCGKGPKFKGNIYTEWGVKYEDVAVRLYELRTKNKIYEFGVLKHPKIPFLGASPDGITAKGIMLEIKCPFSRKITGIVPKHYWMQIQGQLEVCDLSCCDFLECKISEYSGITEYLNDTEIHPSSLGYKVGKKLQKKYDENRIFLRTEDGMEKGAILTYNTPEGENRYFHSELGVSKEEFEEWAQEIKESVPSSWKERRVSFWRFDLISCVRVERDLNWFEETLPKLEETWNQVEHYKKIGCESLMKNKTEEDMVEEADESEINALVNNMDGYDDDADDALSFLEKTVDVKPDFDDADDFIGTDIPEEKVQINSIKKEQKVSMVVEADEKKSMKLLPENSQELKVVDKNHEWTVSQLEAIFDMQLASWSLPKYIPLNPVVINKRSIEEFKIDLTGMCKIVSRCKTALVRLNKCSPELISNSEINIRNIINRVNNWFHGLSDFLKDLLETSVNSEINLPKDLQETINNTKETTKIWTEKLYPKWLKKF